MRSGTVDRYAKVPQQQCLEEGLGGVEASRPMGSVQGVRAMHKRVWRGLWEKQTNLVGAGLAGKAEGWWIRDRLSLSLACTDCHVPHRLWLLSMISKSPRLPADALSSPYNSDAICAAIFKVVSSLPL